VSELAITLALAAISIGALHSLAPDHWIPIAAVGRARGWSAAHTARVVLACGFGHVTMSVVLGLVALSVGRATMTALGEQVASVSGVLLVGFGVAYAVWGVRHALAHRLHGHHHDHYDHVHDPGRVGAWTLFAIYCADPCVALIPILFAAAPLPASSTIGIIAAYEIATIAAMVTMVSLARAGAGFLRGRWTAQWGDSVAGGSSAATGIAVALLGW
jgi:nickel/cobalt exporter